MFVKKLALPLLSLGVIGATALIAQVPTDRAVAAPLQNAATPIRECVYRAAGNTILHGNANGETILYVPRDSALMRDRGGPRTFYHPEFRDKLVSVELRQGCRTVIFGQFGAAWGHKVVRQTGSIEVPANHVGGVKCECS